MNPEELEEVTLEQINILLESIESNFGVPECLLGNYKLDIREEPTHEM